MTTINISITMIEDVLKWYALLCICLTPVTLLLVLYMIKKKPKTVEKINRAIDRILDGKAAEDNAEANTEPVSESPDAPEPKSIEEQNEDIGIANLNMILGDTYRCYLTPANIQNIGVTNMNDWKSSNKFVADFTDKNNESVIHTLHAGKAIIYSGNMEIYHLNVRPAYAAFSIKYLNCVLDGIHYSNLKKINKNRRILKDSQTRRMLSFDSNWDCPKMTYGWDARGNVTRLLVEVEEKNGTYISDTLKMLEAYFQEMDLKDKFENVTYWYRGAPAELAYGNEFDDTCVETVEFVAMVRNTGKGTCYIGFSVIWRHGADVYEVYNNPQMTDRCFEGMLPDDMIKTIRNLEPKKDRPKDQEQTEYHHEENHQQEHEERADAKDEYENISEEEQDDIPDPAEDDTAAEDADIYHGYEDGFDPNDDEGDGEVDDIDSEPF